MATLVKKGFERGIEPIEIVAATKQHGIPKFLIKWKDSHIDIVPAIEANAKCLDLVFKFYEEHTKDTHDPEDVIQNKDGNFTIPRNGKENSFERGVQPSEILSRVYTNGQYYVGIRFKDGVTELVRAKEAYRKCPQMVLNFYESRIVFDDD